MDPEYYSTVFKWFEKSGIISNVRTQLRKNLISALQNKDLSLNRENNTPKPAKQYIYDLLVAEYLFNFNYAYTLSVFASEAPLLINFHNYTSECSETNEITTRKLQTDYICHVLETLGIQLNDPQGRSIISKYTNSEMPLIVCIIKCLAMLPLKENICESCKVKNINQQEEKECRDQYSQTELKEDKTLSVTQLISAKKKILQQKDVFDSELKKKEISLKEQALAVGQQLSNLNKKLEHVQNLMGLINSKEKNLIEERKNDTQIIFKKEMELALKEKLLAQESERLEKERNSYRKFEGDLKKLQEELIKVQKEILKGTQHNYNTKDIEVQTKLDYKALHTEEIKILNKEKQDLINLVQEQQNRIEQLTLRAVQLSRQLEEIHLLKSNNDEINSGKSLKIANAQTVINESSSTEDILQDAKMRLKKLEEESIKAEQHYFAIKNADFSF